MNLFMNSQDHSESVFSKRSLLTGECVYVCHGVCVGVRGHLAGIYSLLLPYGPQGVMSGGHSLGGKSFTLRACLWACFFEQHYSYFYAKFYENTDMLELYHFFYIKKPRIWNKLMLKKK